MSQHWFPESETVLATSILALMLPLGIAVGYGATTIYVEEAEDVPTMNWAWFIPAAFTLATTLVFVRSSKPPSPPSRSAEADQLVDPYLTRWK